MLGAPNPDLTIGPSQASKWLLCNGDLALWYMNRGTSSLSQGAGVLYLGHVSYDAMLMKFTLEMRSRRVSVSSSTKWESYVP
jgi:hypothetical protein